MEWGGGGHWASLASTWNAFKMRPQHFKLIQRKPWPTPTELFCELQMSNYSATVADYQNYVAGDPSDSGAWYNLGLAQSDTGDLQGSIASYTKALQLKPDYYEAYTNRGIDYNLLGEYQQALGDFNQAIKLGKVQSLIQVAAIPIMNWQSTKRR